MTTMKEIAEKAGVSQSTVSRVINGHTSVSLDKRKKVMKWARKLDYEPNINAQSLVNKESYLLGVIIPQISNPYFSQIVETVEYEAKQHGYNILLCNAQGNLQEEKNYLNTLRSRQVDGILIAPVKSRASHLNSLVEREIPAVTITQESKQFASVSVSHIEGGKKVAKHLLNLGHTRIGFIGSPNDPKFAGLKAGMQVEGIEFNDENLIEIEDWGGRAISHEVEEKLKTYLEGKEELPVTAFFAYNDLAAFGTLTAFKDFGLEVPTEVAVVGFDNTFLAQESRPKLTSVAQPMEEIGRLSVEILLEKIAKKSEKVEEEHIVLDPRLVVRESTRKVSVK